MHDDKDTNNNLNNNLNNNEQNPLGSNEPRQVNSLTNSQPEANQSSNPNQSDNQQQNYDVHTNEQQSNNANNPNDPNINNANNPNDPNNNNKNNPNDPKNNNENNTNDANNNASDPNAASNPYSENIHGTWHKDDYVPNRTYTPDEQVRMDTTKQYDYNSVNQESSNGSVNQPTSYASADSQKSGNAQNNGYNGSPVNNYYTENYKKKSKDKNSSSKTWKYILVSAISSVVGGAIVAAMLLIVAPIVQPQIKDFFSDVFPNSDMSVQPPVVSEIKKVEIVQSDVEVITSVAEKVGPSVVGIRTSYEDSNDLFGMQQGGGEGSGIIISKDGYIMTNHHVIEKALNDKTRSIRAGAKIQVFLPNKIDKPYNAVVKGYDAKTDLAVLKIQENNLPNIQFGNSDKLKVGEAVVAIGNPGGLEYMGSVTNGVVSGLNRTVQLEGGKKIKLIQTNAAINPGNSGGALVNLKGELIGVNTVKLVANGFEGLGFAIPVNDAKSIADELIQNNYIPRPYLGISVDQRYNEELAKSNNMPMGVYVADVEMLGAAYKAGIQPNDVITKFNGAKITSFDELEEQKNKTKPGQTVKVEVFRNGKTITVDVTLGQTK